MTSFSPPGLLPEAQHETRVVGGQIAATAKLVASPLKIAGAVGAEPKARQADTLGLQMFHWLLRKRKAAA